MCTLDRSAISAAELGFVTNVVGCSSGVWSDGGDNIRDPIRCSSLPESVFGGRRQAVDRESTRVCCRLRALLCVRCDHCIDTTTESARCLQNHTSNGSSHATNARSWRMTKNNSSRAHAENKQVRVNSLVRVANPPTVYPLSVRACNTRRALDDSVERERERTFQHHDSQCDCSFRALQGLSTHCWA